MGRKAAGLLAVLVTLLLLSNHLGTASAQAPTAWQDKVDPEVLEAAALGETDFLIYMTEQADVSGAADLRTKAEKGAYVYEQLSATANETQPAVTTVLNGLGVTYRPFLVVNALHARGNLAVVQAVASLDSVGHIYRNVEGGIDLPEVAETTSTSSAPTAIEWNIALARAPEAWEMGFTGQDVVIAGADTGVFWEHEALKEQYRGWNGTTADHSYNWHDGTPIVNTACPGSSPEPCDDDEFLGGGHGTHTMGTMVGDDGGENQIGMAPGAEWIACRNMYYGVGAIVTYMDCMEWFLAPTDQDDENPRTDMAPHVINNSWACVEGCDPNNPAELQIFQVLRTLVQNLRAAGIVYVASAGNDGPACSTIEFPPAVYPESFTVGATDINDAIADFSSRGPVILSSTAPEPMLKPNISAPGVDVRSSLRDGSYGELSGTSMAGPHVAGLVALVISARPSLAGDVDTIENIIEESALHLTTTEACGGDSPTQTPNNTFGHGRIDALAAVELAASPTSVQLDGLGAQSRSGANLAFWAAGALLLATGLTLLVRHNRR